jgi:hypothetical protein
MSFATRPPVSGVCCVIYVVAAYTITLCALALYGVLLQHRERLFAANADTMTTGTAGSLPRGFNVGAALLSAVWMWGHGMRGPGGALIVLCAMLIPLYDREMWMPFLFLAMVPLAAGAALGFVGNRIAVSHRGVESLAEFSTSQLPWATAGVALYAFVLPWVGYLLYAARA